MKKNGVTVASDSFLLKNHDTGRTSLGKYDEGFHQNEKFLLREWWYFNVIFNSPKSDLKNWIFKCSINSAVDNDSIKFFLHNANNQTLGSLYVKPKGETIASTPGVDAHFGNSFIKGMYPKWSVHMENTGFDDTELIADVTFSAKTKPLWIFKNTGKNLSTSSFGYYLVMNVAAKGTIQIDNQKYEVEGLGYYDHTWSPYAKIGGEKSNLRGNVWDWLLVRLDNGLNYFIAKIYPNTRSFFPVFIPGYFLCYADDGSFLENYLFYMKYNQFMDSKKTHLRIPTNIDIKSLQMISRHSFPYKTPLYFDFNYQIKNIHEYIYEKKFDFGQWDSIGTINAKITSRSERKQITGLGIMEYMTYL